MITPRYEARRRDLQCTTIPCYTTLYLQTFQPERYSLVDNASHWCPSFNTARSFFTIIDLPAILPTRHITHQHASHFANVGSRTLSRENRPLHTYGLRRRRRSYSPSWSELSVVYFLRGSKASPDGSYTVWHWTVQGVVLGQTTRTRGAISEIAPGRTRTPFSAFLIIAMLHYMRMTSADMRRTRSLLAKNHIPPLPLSTPSTHCPRSLAR